MHDLQLFFLRAVFVHLHHTLKTATSNLAEVKAEVVDLSSHLLHSELLRAMGNA